MATSVIARVDHECQGEVFWAAFREAVAAHRGEPEVIDAARRLLRDDEVDLLSPALIEAFDAFVTALPGWDDGEASEYALHPITFVAV